MDPEDHEQFKTLHASSRTLPVPATSSSQSPQGRDLCSLKVATSCANGLLGCYRRGDAADPESYVSALVVVLMGYPEQVVLRVTHPAGGLPGTSTFLPSVAEVRAACEAEMLPIYEAERRRRLLDENAKLLGPMPLLTEVERDRRREFIAGWKADVMTRLGRRESDPRKMREGSPERAALMADLDRDLKAKLDQWAALDARRAPVKEEAFD